MRFDFKNFLVLLLLLSPSLSIAQLTLGIFVPNEKLAFLFILIQCVLNGYILNNIKIVKPIFAIAFLFTLIAIIHCLIGIQNITTFNTAYIFFALPIYISYFSKNIKYTIQNFMWIVFINIFISVFQQINMLADPNWINIFNNYSHQSGYIYPNNDFGFYRTSGLFYESSQYSLLLAIYFIFFINKIIKITIFSSSIFYFQSLK